MLWHAWRNSEYVRVLLVLDSITRFAHALREVATGSGEHPVARGYPASVFTDLPKLLERAGPGPVGGGSITAVISVLVDGDDHNDPVADSVRGILDGHVVLDRAIAEQGRYPPVNPLSSISRLADKAWSPEQRMLVTRLKSMISRFEDTRDIRLLGAYQGGADAELDIAVRQVPLIYEALTKTGGSTDGDAVVAAMKGMAWESPRGLISIDPETRDIVQDIYVRRVERVSGELYNIEFDKFEAVKDPIKAAQRK